MSGQNQVIIADLPGHLAAGNVPMPHAGQLAAALGLDPSTAVGVRCEADGCNAVVPLGAAFSIYAEYRVQGGAYASCVCPHREQHFGCSHEHALAALLDCVQNHQKDGRGVVHPSLRTTESSQ